MKTYRTLAAVAWLAAAQAGAAPPPLPDSAPAPLLHVVVNGPPGMRVTFYQGAAAPREYPAPVVVGLRPGYVYRIKVSNFPDRPGFTAFPTLEVRGTLRLPADLSARRFPAGVYLSEFDADRLAAGALITKVVYLEHPRNAFAEPGRVAQPIEVHLPGDRDPLDESRQYGRPVLVMRAGDRDATEQELKQLSVPGTILLPGEKGLGVPTAPPHLPWACFAWYDPLIGKRPAEEECLHDGGDRGPCVGIDGCGKLQGLDPEDTVAEYRDCSGRRRIAVSNRVCICVPRFAVLRTETQLDLARLVLGPLDVGLVKAQLQLEGLLTPLPYEQFKQPNQLIGSLRPSAAEVLITTAVVGRVEGLEVVTAQLKMADVTGVCQPPEAPEKPLVLCKWSDRMEAQVGDVLTFTIRYSNHGGKPIADVVVSDSLTGRLEYVPGSAKGSRNAVFTTQPNESGSTILRWAIAGRLLPGESGTVSFQARVR